MGNIRRMAAIGAAVAGTLGLAAIPVASATPTARTSGSGNTASCVLGTGSGRIKHVIYLQFDNVHLRRDNPNVPSDLEQMPHLLNFLKGNGRRQSQLAHRALSRPPGRDGVELLRLLPPERRAHLHLRLQVLDGSGGDRRPAAEHGQRRLRRGEERSSPSWPTVRRRFS